MLNHDKNDKNINIALPVLAIECEATPPLERHLDAYEETVLKLISIGLSTSGIASTLNATESLVEEILDSLDQKKYAFKESRHPWVITEDGNNYLKGIVKDRQSDNSQYGYMFVNAIKKDVLPFFFQGDLNHIPPFILLEDGDKLPLKLLVDKNEEKTFEEYKPKRISLRNAYKKFINTSSMSNQYREGDITLEEAVDTVDLFEDLDEFDESDIASHEDESNIENQETKMKNNMFIRALNCPQKRVYLTMQIEIDPLYPGGYRVKSPFNLNGLDNNYFLRQIQWLAAKDNIFIENCKLDYFLTSEIKKIAPNFSSSEKDFSVFVIEKMPLLKLQKSRFNEIYENFSRIYCLMQRQGSKLEKESIVSAISRFVLEKLFNEFFKSVNNLKLEHISKQAKNDLKYYGINAFKRNIFRNTHIDHASVNWRKDYILTVIDRLITTRGNSIYEKFINVLVLNYYIGTPETRLFLSSKNGQQIFDLTDKLNRIRRKVSHDTEEEFVTKDYDYFISNVFTLINHLLEAFKEA